MTMTSYVLVHGAWHGGWCWSKVASVLSAAGNTVYTPTLSGLSERANLLSRETDLETHVQDVLSVLKTENLTDVVLVGHSYGGMVVTAVADRVSARIARLVYLDAVVPRDGESVLDRVPAQFKARLEEQVKVSGDGWYIPVGVASPKFLGLERAEDIQWVLPKLTSHPARTFRDAVHLVSNMAAVPRSYINCIGNQALGQPKSMEAEGIDDYYELQTGHNAMVTEPQAVAQLLLEIATRKNHE